VSPKYPGRALAEMLLPHRCHFWTGHELVLVDPAINAVAAQAFAELPNAVFVLRRIVAVADERSHGCALH
jgi:hypothetical protein